MSDTGEPIGYIGDLVVRDEETGKEEVLYPTTYPDAILELGTFINTILGKKKKTQDVTVTGDGTKYVSFPVIPGFVLIQVISKSGTDYICHGVSLDSNSYVAELANALDAEQSATFTCVYTEL